ncbi:Abi family protein [Mucilaginibacter sp.]|uniref:Abi family protein n=1 Tax=Mucilaginibacter sp. TaxID=1882438 RepID=UPI002630A66C|nr:Abi family protein [Mucilaginibacter sp.]
MPRVPYSKPPLTFNDQLQQLKNRGLIIERDSKCLFLLETISYYRLSGYWYPMLQMPKSTHVFKPNSSFNSSFNLYCFDRELRKLVTAEIEKIEIAIRAKMIYVLSHEYGAFWFSDAALFSNNVKFRSTLNRITEEYDRSKEDFIASFKVKYNNPLPPSWIILEVSSFGVLSNLYQNLKPGRAKREISHHFGLDDSTFESWIHSIAYIRNVCAHHSRLWNKALRISPVIPNNPQKTLLSVYHTINSNNGSIRNINNRTYYILSMIVYLSKIVNPKTKFKNKFISLLNKYPNVDPLAMGFTNNWKQEELWKIEGSFFKRIIVHLGWVK